MNRIKLQSGSHSTLLISLLIVLTLMLLRPAQALGQSQWATSGNNINNTNTGSVGIGTSNPSPTAKVHIVNNEVLRLQGLGTSGDASWGYVTMYDSNGTTRYAYFGDASYADKHFYINTENGAQLILQAGAGKVGIGTTSPATKLHVVGDITVTGNINAKYQDVAEWVPAAGVIPTGTVVVLDPTRNNQVLPSAKAYDTGVAGVISERPGLALGESGEGKVLVATTGRVKVKVDASRAPIHIGDLLVTSDEGGMAMKSEPVKVGDIGLHRPGTLIGKALEPLAQGKGEILVLLSLQ